MIEHSKCFVCLVRVDWKLDDPRSSTSGSFAPDGSGFKLSGGRYRAPILVQDLSNVHHGDGVCHDQPKVCFSKRFAWTHPPAEPPHRVDVLEDLGSGWVHEAVRVKDLWVGVYILVSCETPGMRTVRLKVIGDGSARGTKGWINAYQIL